MGICGECGHEITDEECNCTPVDLETLHIPHDPKNWVSVHRECETQQRALEVQLDKLRLGIIHLSNQARFMSHLKMEKELMKLLESSTHD